MRSTIQPGRRASLPRKVTDDLVLHLKYNGNLDDSSYWDQTITKHNESIVPSATKVIDYPAVPATGSYYGKALFGIIPSEKMSVIKNIPSYHPFRSKVIKNSDVNAYGVPETVQNEGDDLFDNVSLLLRNDGSVYGGNDNVRSSVWQNRAPKVKTTLSNGDTHYITPAVLDEDNIDAVPYGYWGEKAGVFDTISFNFGLAEYGSYYYWVDRQSLKYTKDTGQYVDKATDGHGFDITNGNPDGDFTIEFWARPKLHTLPDTVKPGHLKSERIRGSAANGGDLTGEELATKMDSVILASKFFVIGYNERDGYVAALRNGDNNTNENASADQAKYVVLASSYGKKTDGWDHVALVKEGATVDLLINGAAPQGVNSLGVGLDYAAGTVSKRFGAAWDDPRIIYLNGSTQAWSGRIKGFDTGSGYNEYSVSVGKDSFGITEGPYGTPLGFVGHLDNIRITNGVARYPTYPDSPRFGTITAGHWHFGSQRWVPPSNFPDFGSDDISNELYTAFFEGGTYVNYKPKLDDLGEFEDVTTDYNFLHGAEARCRAIEALAYDHPLGPNQIGNWGKSRTFGNSDYIIHSSRDGQGVSRIFIITISPYSFESLSGGGGGAGTDTIYYNRSGTSTKDMHGLTSAQLSQFITLIPKTQYAEKRKCVGNFCYNLILSAYDAGSNSSNPIYNGFSKINSSDGTAESPGTGNRRQGERVTSIHTPSPSFLGQTGAPKASRIRHERTLFDGRLLYVYVNAHPQDYILVYFMGTIRASQQVAPGYGAWPAFGVDNAEIPMPSDYEFVTTGLREEDGYEKWETQGYYAKWKPTLMGKVEVTDNLLNIYGNTNVVVNKGACSYLYDLSGGIDGKINIITHKIGPSSRAAYNQSQGTSQTYEQEWTAGDSYALLTRLDDVLVVDAYAGGRIAPKVTPYMFTNDKYVFLLDSDNYARGEGTTVQELNIFKIQSDGQLKKIKTENLRKSGAEGIDAASYLYTYVKGDYLYVNMRRWGSGSTPLDLGNRSYTDVYEVSDNGLRKVHDGTVADYTVLQVVGNYLATVSNTLTEGLSAARAVESNHKLRNTYDNISYTRLTENPQSLLVSGSGVYSTDPLKDSAEELNFDDDFCIEGYVKFNKIPEGSDEDPGCVIFDWGNLKLSNTSGFWSVQAPDGDVVDYFDPDHIDEKSWKYLPNRYIHFAVQRREDNLQLWLDDANLGTHAVDPNTIPNQYDSTEGYLGVDTMGLAVEDRGNNQFNPTDKETISGISGSPYNSARSIGSTVSGTNFFTGIMRDFKVWEKAVYGPVDVLIGKQPSAEGIHGNGATHFYYYYYNQLRSFRLNNLSYYGQQSRWQPYRTIYAYDGNSITLSCTYTSVIDPRYSINQPLPVLIQWYHKGQFIGDSQNGVSVNSAKYRINSMGKGELTITNIDGDDQGYYDARVSIGPFNRPKYTWYSYWIAGGGATNMGMLTSINLLILQHPKPPPPPKAQFTMFSCNIGDVPDGTLDPDALGSHGPATRGPLQLGDDAEMLATFYPYNQPWANLYRPPEVLPPGPMTYTWSKKGRGQQSDRARVFAGGSPIANGRNYAWPSSSLRFTNVRKSIKGPICVEAFDANGVSHGKVCCAGLDLRLPDLVKIQSRVTPIPSASSTYWELVDYKKTRGWRYGYWNYNVLYKNLYTYTIRSIGQFASAPLTLGPVASDPNVAELNTGGIQYKWRIYGYDDGVLIDETTTYNSSDATKTYNITDNFNGNIYCYMQYANYPANQYSDDPEGRSQWGPLTTVQWTVGAAECVEPTAQVKAIAGATQRAKISANWWDQFFYGTEYTRKGFVENLPKNRESQTEELTVFYRGCEDVVVPIGYWDANNVEIQNVRTELATHHNVGVTNSITFDSSIWTDSKFVPHPTFWNRANYAAQRPAYLVLRGTITSARHGTSTEIVLNNDCGQRKIRIKFHSYNYRPPAASPVSTIRYFYLQKRLTYSWTGVDSNNKPIGGDVSERTDTSPNYIQCAGYLYNYNPCFAWRTRLVGPHNSGGWSAWYEKAQPRGIMVHHNSDYVTLIEVNMQPWNNYINSGYYHLRWHAKIYANALPGTTEDCTFEVQISSNPAVAGDWDNGTKATNSFLIKRIERPTLLSHTCGSRTAIYNGKGPWWGCFGGRRRWTTPRWWWRPYWYWRRSGQIVWRRYYPYYVRPRRIRGGTTRYTYMGYSALRGGRSSYFAFRR